MPEYIREAFSCLRENRLRALLTMLGIVIGIASIVAVLAVGQGGRLRVADEFDHFGVSRIWLYADLNIDADGSFTEAEVNMLRQTLPIRAAYPLTQSRCQANFWAKNTEVELVGTDRYYQNIEKVELLQGRFLNQTDMEQRRNVVVVSDTLCNLLNLGDEPLGKNIFFDQRGYTIVGVWKEGENSYTQNGMVSRCFLPIVSIPGSYAGLAQGVVLLSRDNQSIPQIGQDALSILAKDREPDTVKTINLIREVRMAESILLTFTMVISCVAVISLIVGGIGMMNIMLVTVKERTQEIGVRKAIGATDRQIMIQFLLESLTLSLIGGAIGIVLGMTMGYAATSFAEVPFSVDSNTMIGAVLFAAAIGIFFGLYPAWRAAQLDPADALRRQ